METKRLVINASLRLHIIKKRFSEVFGVRVLGILLIYEQLANYLSSLSYYYVLYLFPLGQGPNFSKSNLECVLAALSTPLGIQL